jgi:hypothetical protein
MTTQATTVTSFVRGILHGDTGVEKLLREDSPLGQLYAQGKHVSFAQHHVGLAFDADQAAFRQQGEPGSERPGAGEVVSYQYDRGQLVLDIARECADEVLSAIAVQADERFIQNQYLRVHGKDSGQRHTSFLSFG